MLYQWDIGGRDFEAVAATFWTLDREAGDADERVRTFAGRLAGGTVGSLGRIDALIAERTEHWRPERMAVIDRLILRLGVYELLEGGTPPTVVINEALELARTFSTEDAVRFINGVLDGVHKVLSTRPGVDDRTE
jgi:transcription antitermination protein NusB